MANFWTNIGEEWAIENDLNGATLDVGLFDRSVDPVDVASDLGDITTEPGGAAYSRQSVSVSTKALGTDFGFDNDSDVVFDVSDSSRDVDHAFYVVTFQSDGVSGDSSPQDHLVIVAELTQVRDLSQFQEIKFPVGDLSGKAVG